MRDGVALVSDIYRPDTEGEFPVLLQRTPYDREGPASEARDLKDVANEFALPPTSGKESCPSISHLFAWLVCKVPKRIFLPSICFLCPKAYN